MDIFKHLGLPDSCIDSFTLTKVFFKRNFMLTSADKNLLEDASLFQEMKIYARLRPDNSNIPAYNSDVETYEEILYITVVTAAESLDKSHQRVAHFIQKYIPYHLMICVLADDDSKYSLHLARKDISKINKTERVITESISTSVLQATDIDFLQYFALAKLTKANIRTVYNNYIALIYSKQIAELTNQYQPLPYDVAMEYIIVLRNIVEKEQNLAILRTKIKKEMQLNEQVELNTQIHQLREEIKELTNSLSQ